MDIITLFGTFIILIALTVPIGYAIGISTLVTLVFFSNTPLALITQNCITGVDSFPLMAIPFFMLAGNLMSSGGVAKRIVNFCDTLLGWITGGLGIVTTLACMIFAAISGSAVATTSAIGGVIGIALGVIMANVLTAVIAVVLGTGNDGFVAVPTLGGIAVSFGVSVGVGILFGYLPANKAAKLNPIDALRYE